MCKLNLTAQLVQKLDLERAYSDYMLCMRGRFCLSPRLALSITGVNYFTYMPADPKKVQALRASGTLNPHPEKVRAPRFAEKEFFDPNDLVQLKYETLRAVEVDGQPLSVAAADSGLSRPTIYEAQTNFLTHGMEGLLPKKRGPKNPHKLRPEIWKFIEETLISDPELKSIELVQKVRQRFGVNVHPRTVEKALKKAKKGRQPPPPNRP
jgi:transposase